MVLAMSRELDPPTIDEEPDDDILLEFFTYQKSSNFKFTLHFTYSLVSNPSCDKEDQATIFFCKASDPRNLLQFAAQCALPPPTLHHACRLRLPLLTALIQKSL
ncbi:hypothetical protein L1987_10804 [Smallanthus sonchifolius]|uniref:Uncharacterized protein n=1 Tax=Smallanthus sonchifolius TaxID=185202 RepID=A0ACB9JCL2_9ASTR|nr:hypothetical protein L1987_10804 [Smallanthus sonchifolius]